MVSGTSGRRVVLGCLAIGACITGLPAVWFDSRIGRILVAPGGWFLRLIGTTDDIRVIDYVAYFAGGTLMWSTVCLAVCVGSYFVWGTRSAAA